MVDKASKKKGSIKAGSKGAKYKVSNKKVRPIIVIDNIFLVSLVLSVIFGLQTNPKFLVPFTIVLIITIICMGIILVNAIYKKIKSKIKNKRG